ncbi:LPS export ABC transporter periplasmic protein LptC [bacterium]|nr:LPS export ABC transporter periplasmic protein LptC [bacterium]
MALKNILKDKRNIIYIGLLSIVILACFWAFVSAGMITKSFKDKIIDKTYKNKEANIESLLVTETKDGAKLWELYADEGTYTDSDNIVLLQNLIGNFYEGNTVKASFQADAGTYNATTKQIILYNNVILVYEDGTNLQTERLKYSGKEEDIIAEGNVRIEKPGEAVIIGNKAILSSDYKDFHIEGRTETHFYM